MSETPPAYGGPIRSNIVNQWAQRIDEIDELLSMISYSTTSFRRGEMWEPAGHSIDACVTHAIDLLRKLKELQEDAREQ